MEELQDAGISVIGEPIQTEQKTEQTFYQILFLITTAITNQILHLVLFLVLQRLHLTTKAIFLQSVGAILGLHGGELGEGATV